VVNGNQKTVDPFTGTSVVFPIKTGWNFLGTGGIRNCPAAMNGAPAKTAEIPPITFKKSLLDSPGFLVGEAPSKPVLKPLPQQFVRSEHDRHSFEKV
jgi:hypothetical protein